MLKEYQFTNFKAFAGPVNIPIKPITLIFGANSSGKSAILQPLLMLKQSIEAGRSQDVNLIPKGNLVDLGSFRDFIYNHDLNLSFSFKAVVRPHSIEYGALRVDKSALEFVVGLHPHIEILDRSLGDETIGVSISFTFEPESSTIIITYVDLYIGDEPYPVITYKKYGWGPSDYKFVGNFNHKFWEKYWENFDAKDSKEIEKFMQEQETALESDEEFLEMYKNMSPEQKEDILKRLMDLDKAKTFPKIKDQIDRDETNTEIKENINGLTDFQLAIEKYKKLFKHNEIGLEGLFPRTINNNEIRYLINDYASWDESRDVSLFLITAGHFIEQFLKDIVYIAPLRKYPERYYMYGGSSVQYVGISGEMAPDILFYESELLLKVNRELDRFGSNYELKVSRLSNEESDTNDVFILQLLNKSTGVVSSLRDVGFGFSQVLPIIVQSIISEKSTLVIEQPELHLHPALQAELGDLFINSALSDQKNKFLIETHSEHLILRIMRRMRETAEGEFKDGPPVTPNDVCILYVDQPKDKNYSVVYEMRLDKDGTLLDPWPGGFFEEGFKERFL